MSTYYFITLYRNTWVYNLMKWQHCKRNNLMKLNVKIRVQKQLNLVNATKSNKFLIMWFLSLHTFVIWKSLITWALQLKRAISRNNDFAERTRKWTQVTNSIIQSQMTFIYETTQKKTSHFVVRWYIRLQKCTIPETSSQYSDLRNNHWKYFLYFL